MLRQEVLKLYRNFFQSIRTVPDITHKKEIADWVRTDFKNNKHHTDEYTIKMLLQTGRRSLNELEVNLGLSGLKRDNKK